MRPWASSIIALLCLSGCVSTHSDRFYALEPQPVAAATTKQKLATAVSLKVTVPSLVDRNELVLRDGGGVIVLEHERWAAPLVDQVAVVLGQDIEQRRPDILISPRGVSPSGGTAIAISVDIVELSAARSGGVSMEARWRIDRGAGTQPLSGRDLFKQPAAANDYAQLAHATSGCVAQIADRLIQQLSTSDDP
jgi:uncharacterized protein